MSSANLMDQGPVEIEISEENSKWFDLSPKRQLLDSNFEGYKLSLDSFPQYKLDLTENYQLDAYNFTNDERQISWLCIVYNTRYILHTFLRIKFISKTIHSLHIHICSVHINIK